MRNSRIRTHISLITGILVLFLACCSEEIRPTRLPLIEVIQMNVNTFFNGEKSFFLLHYLPRIEAWLSQVTVPAEDLPEKGYFGALNITVNGDSLSARYRESPTSVSGIVQYSGAKITGTLSFTSHDRREYQREFKATEKPPERVPKSGIKGRKGFYDSPKDSMWAMTHMAERAVDRAVAQMVVEVFGIEPLVLAMLKDRSQKFKELYGSEEARDVLSEFKDQAIPVVSRFLSSPQEKTRAMHLLSGILGFQDILGKMNDEIRQSTILEEKAAKSLTSYLNNARHWIFRGDPARVVRELENFQKTLRSLGEQEMLRDLGDNWINEAANISGYLEGQNIGKER